MQSLRHLLEGIIDYAGLFPPAKLAMEPAVRNFADYRRSSRSWMLGRFVVPLGRLDEFAAAARGLMPEDPAQAWELSALLGPDVTTGQGEDIVEAISAFNRAHDGGEQGAARISAVELKASTPEEIQTALAVLPEDLEPFFELEYRSDPAALIAALRGSRGRAKIRSGGITSDAFPDSRELARFIHRCVEDGVPFKATAGLHHPLRGSYRLTYEPDSADGTMHGFLNVFLAAALAGAGKASEQDLRELLEERSSDAFSFRDDGVAWRGLDLSAEDLAQGRQAAALSYGSCSFTEPIEDLEELALL